MLTPLTGIILCQAEVMRNVRSERTLGWIASALCQKQTSAERQLFCTVTDSRTNRLQLQASFQMNEKYYQRP